MDPSIPLYKNLTLHDEEWAEEKWDLEIDDEYVHRFQ
jgi:hypothetical protein